MDDWRARELNGFLSFFFFFCFYSLFGYGSLARRRWRALYFFSLLLSIFRIINFVRLFFSLFFQYMRCVWLVNTTLGGSSLQLMYSSIRIRSVCLLSCGLPRQRQSGRHINQGSYFTTYHSQKKTARQLYRLNWLIIHWLRTVWIIVNTFYIELPT